MFSSSLTTGVRCVCTCSLLSLRTAARVGYTHTHACIRAQDKHAILTSIDGPHNNVIVMKPPMLFSKDNVDEFVAALLQALVDIQMVDLDAVPHTPT
eukprot:m.1535638 g.1535638  ORF g.1535638 m.1535638 type:complete len:97 (+) comp25243_c0_seq79:1623-1913(+)